MPPRADSGARLVDCGDGRFRLEGELTLRSVATLARESERLFPRPRARLTPQPARLELDLSGVVQATSVGLALLLDWQARAQARGGSLRISHWPASLLRIARFSNLSELLELPAQCE